MGEVLRRGDSFAADVEMTTTVHLPQVPELLFRIAAGTDWDGTRDTDAANAAAELDRLFEDAYSEFRVQGTAWLTCQMNDHLRAQGEDAQVEITSARLAGMTYDVGISRPWEGHGPGDYSMRVKVKVTGKVTENPLPILAIVLIGVVVLVFGGAAIYSVGTGTNYAKNVRDVVVTAFQIVGAAVAAVVEAPAKTLLTPLALMGGLVVAGLALWKG